MKGAIASVEIYAWPKASSARPVSASASAPAPAAPGTEPGAPRRLTLVVGAPRRDAEAADLLEWGCRVALADWKRPVEIRGVDSVEALRGAMTQGQRWLDELREAGFRLTRDRAGQLPYVPEGNGSAPAG
ncbi:MAG: hypothetical protein AB8G23_06995 [Myxococcota bacterium]